MPWECSTSDHPMGRLHQAQYIMYLTSGFELIMTVIYGLSHFRLAGGGFTCGDPLSDDLYSVI